jgi:Flp pilus assembly protein TadD
MPFPASQSVDPRDLALAWTSLAKSGRSADETQERHLLLAALKRTPDDPELLSALGYFEQKRGATDEARQLYRKALRLTPESIVAATNLGVIEAQAGRVIEAVKLWQDAFKRAPDRSSIGMNIARVYCQAGKIDEARDYVLRVLEFSLDRDPAKKMLRELGGSPANCGP